MNFNKICRICIGTHSGMKSIFETYNFSPHNCEISKVITDCASVQIQKFDGFSEQICQNCLDHLSQAYSFKKLCEDSDYKFRNNLIPCDEIVIKSEFSAEDPIINYKQDDSDIQENSDELSKFTNFDSIYVKTEGTVNQVSSLTVKLENQDIPQEVDSADVACISSLPQKSRALYEKTYNEFIMWCTEKRIMQYSESDLLAYFSDIAGRGITASLWPKYSMLKTTLNIHHDIDISKYNKLNMFIKRETKGYKPKKSKVIEKEQVQTFISDAPDSLFLMTKVVLIFGVAGALRKHELLKLEKDDVQDLTSKFLVTIRASKRKTNRIFTIVDNEQNTRLNLIRHYISLRPRHTKHQRFFIFYKNNKCSTQPVGVNTFSKLPSQIATFLKLEQPHLYTGHCFRRSSASILSDASADFAAIKRHSGRRSTAVAEGYIENSIENKVSIDEKILSPLPQASTSSDTE